MSDDTTGERRVLCLATQGDRHSDAERIRALLAPLGFERFRFDHDHRRRSALALLRTVLARRPRLIVMEGTGMAGGLVLLAVNAVLGVPFVISSGDAVGPFLRLHSRAAGAGGELYERLLCRNCAGFIGWTPYLAGRAITFGAPRAMTAPGWARKTLAGRASANSRGARRPPRRSSSASRARCTGTRGGATSTAQSSCRRCAQGGSDVFVCIVGDGDGLERLREPAGAELGGRVLLPGRVAPEQVPD